MTRWDFIKEIHLDDKFDNLSDEQLKVLFKHFDPDDKAKILADLEEARKKLEVRNEAIEFVLRVGTMFLKGLL